MLQVVNPDLSISMRYECGPHCSPTQHQPLNDQFGTSTDQFCPFCHPPEHSRRQAAEDAQAIFFILMDFCVIGGDNTIFAMHKRFSQLFLPDLADYWPIIGRFSIPFFG
jgi:hypothetical protein